MSKQQEADNNVAIWLKPLDVASGSLGVSNSLWDGTSSKHYLGDVEFAIPQKLLCFIQLELSVRNDLVNNNSGNGDNSPVSHLSQT